jgi:hypothetical protein
MLVLVLEVLMREIIGCPVCNSMMSVMRRDRRAGFQNRSEILGKVDCLIGMQVLKFPTLRKMVDIWIRGRSRGGSM